jgi:hypothetical protein
MYQNIDEMKQDLNKFLIFYNFNRGHGGLRKEIKVRTPYEALEYWLCCRAFPAQLAFHPYKLG